MELETPKAVKYGWNLDILVSPREVNFGEMGLAAVDQSFG